LGKYSHQNNDIYEKFPGKKDLKNLPAQTEIFHA
jgi:hypothetical protein